MRDKWHTNYDLSDKISENTRRKEIKAIFFRKKMGEINKNGRIEDREIWEKTAASRAFGQIATRIIGKDDLFCAVI